MDHLEDNNMNQIGNNFYDILPDDITLQDKDGLNEIGSMFSFSDYPSPNASSTSPLYQQLNPPSSTGSALSNDFLIDDVNTAGLNLDEFILNDWGASTKSTMETCDSNGLFYLPGEQFNNVSLGSSPVFSNSDNDSDSGLGSSTADSPKEIEQCVIQNKSDLSSNQSEIILNHNQYINKTNNFNSGLIQLMPMINNNGNNMILDPANNQFIFESCFDDNQLSIQNFKIIS